MLSFFFSSRRRHTRSTRDWSSDVCSSDLEQVRRLVSQAWKGLEPILVELRATRERKAEVENLLTGWLQRARISTDGMMPRLQIGRASCRERVEIEVGAGSVTEKEYMRRAV